MPELAEPPAQSAGRKLLHPPADPAIKAEVKRLFLTGLTPAQVAKTTGVLDATVRLWIKRNGWNNGLKPANHTTSQTPNAQSIKLVSGTVTRIPNARGESTRRKLASSVDKLADAVDSQDVSEPKSLKTVASAVKSLVDSAKTLHGWSEADNSTYAFARLCGL